MDITSSPSSWTTEHVSKWLTDQVELSEYVTVFENNAISGRELLQLSNDDFKDMNIEKVGHRKKLLLEIQSLRQREMLILSSSQQQSASSSQQLATSSQQQNKKRSAPDSQHEEQSNAKRQKLDDTTEDVIPPQLKMKGKMDTMTCMICMEDKEGDVLFKPRNCWTSEACDNVSICTDCLKTYVWDKIQSRSFPITCPNQKCGQEIIPDDLQHLLTPEQMAVYYKYSFEHMISTQGNGKTKFLQCPTPDCKFIVNYDELNDDNCHFRCELCREHYCLKCKVPFHFGKTCIGFQKFKKLEGGGMKVEDALFFQYVDNQHIQRCPSCSRFVERRSGCSSISCLCGANFCYGCGKTMNQCICSLIPPRVPEYQDGDGEDEEEE
jgi:hypothetical protein